MIPPVVLLGQPAADPWDSFLELVLYAVLLAAFVIGVVILKIILKAVYTRRVRSMKVPMGTDGLDLGQMKEKGALTDEELAAIRRSIGRQIMERSQAEQQAAKIPANAEWVLRAAEEELRARKQAEAAESPKPEPIAAPPPPAPASPSASAPPPPPLPEHLASLVDRTALELEQLQEAGFLTQEDVTLIREARQ